MTTLFALFAEVERDLISERTREGLTKAWAYGKKLGRPKGRNRALGRFQNCQTRPASPEPLREVTRFRPEREPHGGANQGDSSEWYRQ